MKQEEEERGYTGNKRNRKQLTWEARGIGETQETRGTGRR
jgi:hypothetical protein